MRFEKPITYELNLEIVLETVDDDDKLELIRIMFESIKKKGLTEQIRKLVNDSIYDD